jgi:hypothetical protein
MIAWVRPNTDPGRAVIIASKTTSIIEMMIQQGRDEGFVVFWHAKHVGWVVFFKESVEKRIEFAFSYKTDIADLHGPISVDWTRTWLPQCVSV